MKISAWRKDIRAMLRLITEKSLRETCENHFKETPSHYDPEVFLFLEELRRRLPKPDYNAFITHLEGLGETR